MRRAIKPGFPPHFYVPKIFRKWLDTFKKPFMPPSAPTKKTDKTAAFI
jgi:hypothetical protein